MTLAKAGTGKRGLIFKCQSKISPKKLQKNMLEVYFAFCCNSSSIIEAIIKSYSFSRLYETFPLVKASDTFH